MRVQWYGQSAFRLAGEKTVFIDPFDRPGEALAARGLEFNYAPIEDVTADLLLITHEHVDHNAAEAIGGDPVTIRSTAGRLDSPVGEVLAIASEHDDVAGTMRGPNTIFRFALDGVTFCHLGDFGQPALAPRAARRDRRGRRALRAGRRRADDRRRAGRRARPLARAAARAADALPDGGGELPRAARRVSRGARRGGHAARDERRRARRVARDGCCAAGRACSRRRSRNS